jgi:hypothetical protein
MIQPHAATHRQRLLVLGLALLVAVFTLLACGEYSNTGTAVNSSSSSSNSNNNSAAPPVQHFKIGQTIKVGDTWQVQVLSAKTSTGSTYNKPLHPGYAFLIVTVAMKNLSSSEQIVSSLTMFNVSDPNGEKQQVGTDVDAGSPLDGKVEAGSPIRGVLAYEIPKGLHTLTLAFAPDLLSAGQTIWDIKV